MQTIVDDITKDIIANKNEFLNTVVETSWSGYHESNNHYVMRCTACQCIYSNSWRINIEIDNVNIILCKVCYINFNTSRKEARITEFKHLNQDHITKHVNSMVKAKTTAHNKLAWILACQPSIFVERRISTNSTNYCGICGELASSVSNYIIKMNTDGTYLVICRDCELGIDKELCIVKNRMLLHYRALLSVGKKLFISADLHDIIPQICHNMAY